MNHSVYVISSGGGGGMDFLYKVEQGNIIFCEARAWNGRTDIREEVPCDLTKLRSAPSSEKYYGLIHPITSVKERDPRSGKKGQDAPLPALRKQIITTELRKARKDNREPYTYQFRLVSSDSSFYHDTFQRILPKYPVVAYKLARDQKNEQDLSVARDRIIERGDLDSALSFFNIQKDKAGYQRTLTAIATTYNIDPKDIQSILNYITPSK